MHLITTLIQEISKKGVVIYLASIILFVLLLLCFLQKYKRLFLSVFFFTFFFSFHGYAENFYSDFYLIENKTHSAKTIPVFIEKNVTYFNIQDLTKYLKIKYIWEPFSRTLELFDGNSRFYLKAESYTALLNNKIILMNNSLKVVCGKIYIPLSVLQAFPSLLKSAEKNRITFEEKSANFNYFNSTNDEITKLIAGFGELKKIEIIQPEKLNVNISKIIIDPGHGGKDPGAISFSRKYFEKDITLAVALKIKKVIQQMMPYVEVLLTRSTDQTLYLNERSNFANANKGDLFISLHCNSGMSAARGVETFYFSLSEEDETERTARLLENKDEFTYKPNDPNKPVNFIMTDMAQINHINESVKFASAIQMKVLEKKLALSRGIKKARFFVLKDTFMPSVLVELGFISNKNDEALLISEDYHNAIAEAIALAIKQ